MFDIVPQSPQLLDENYSAWATDFIFQSKALNTTKAYFSDMKYFLAWQKAAYGQNFWPLDENVVVRYIYENLQEMPEHTEKFLLEQKAKRYAGLFKFGTVRRRLQSLSTAHMQSNHYDPVKSKKVTKLMTAMQRMHEPCKKSKAITKNILLDMLATATESILDIRDAAVLCFGWASGGRRRSEIVDAVIENLDEQADGNFLYNISRSKTDQTGKGHVVPIKGIAAAALRAWLQVSKIKTGYIFRSLTKAHRLRGQMKTATINHIVKYRIKIAGYDPKFYTAHGLRRGFITEAGKQKCPLGDVMALSGHKSVRIAMEYYESGSVINNSASNLM